MLIIDHCVETKAQPQTIWSYYQDANFWPQWDNEIEYAKLFGPFQVGTKGELKPASGPKVKFKLLKVEPFKMYADISYLFLTKLLFTHTLEKTINGTKICHKVEMNGFLKYFWAFVIGRTIKKHMPFAMKKLAELAEMKEKNHAKR